MTDKAALQKVVSHLGFFRATLLGGVSAKIAVREIEKVQDEIIAAIDATPQAAPSLPQLTEEILRAEFVRQHEGRNLKQHRLRGTYLSAPMAALWNQHKRTAEWLFNLIHKP
jgi:hypothetical protein